MDTNSTTSTPPSLAQELSAFKESFKQRVEPARVAMMEVATADLRATGIEQSALHAGDQVSSVTLPDADNNPTALASLWQQGPLVVIFYRGGWCPYCNLELRAWQRELPRLRSMGANLVAISPQTPDNSMSTAEKNALAFKVLSDSELKASDAFGITFTLPPDLVALYSRVGNDLPVINGNGSWALPVPATYALDTEGRVAFAHIEADYRERAEPEQVLAAVERLVSEQAVAS